MKRWWKMNVCICERRHFSIYISSLLVLFLLLLLLFQKHFGIPLSQTRGCSFKLAILLKSNQNLHMLSAQFFYFLFTCVLNLISGSSNTIKNENEHNNSNDGSGGGGGGGGAGKMMKK